MKALLALFPANDFSLIALVLAMPLLGAFVNGVFGRRLGKPAVRLMALTAIGLSFLAAVVTFVGLDNAVTAAGAAGAHHEHEHVKVAWTAWEWMHTSGRGDSIVPIPLRFSVDALSGVMMLVVTGVGFLIHVYAASYMDADKAYWRFFAYLNLFVFSMLVLILGDNLPVLFVGWEGVGLCSYLLIGFWYGKLPNAAAGKKAFIMNRIGDFGLLCGMFLLVYYTNALDWTGIAEHADQLVTPNVTQQVHLWPIGGGTFQDFHIAGLRIPLEWLQPKNPDGSPNPVTITAATAVGIALFLGCTGKSAQLPLYTWLPDAMAGPTPVSALIHAATMVTAGVYLICRLNFVFVLSPAVMTIIAFTGAITALYAACIALVQNDIKKVLAYSTVSQLGFMFLGVGVGAFTAGFFHVFTHAFFKACLFLGAGSVIHSMHVRIHDDDRSQDMRNMGGLRKYMPLTYGTFVAATLAIIGLPFTSGWFSKDEILSNALVNQPVHPYSAELTRIGHTVWTAPHWVPWLLWGIGVVAATLTAFYMCRCVFMTFWGDFKGWTIGRPSQLARSELAAHGPYALEAHDHEGEEAEDDEHHHDEDVALPGLPPHESPRMMTVPLIVLGTASIVAGLLFNPSALKIFKKDFDFLPMEHWLEPVFAKGSAAIKSVAPEEHAHHSLELVSLTGAIVAFALGSYLAYWMYVQQKGKLEQGYMSRATTIVAGFGGLLLAIAGALIMAFAGEVISARMIVPIAMVGIGVWAAWRLGKMRAIGLDYAYDQTVVNGADALSDTAASIDQGFIDFIVARLTSLTVAALGTLLRIVQNGVVHVYAAMMVVGVAALGWFFCWPHADVAVAEHANGDYVLSAGSGVGYGFRWYPQLGAAPSTSAFTANDHIKVHLDEGQSRVVRVEVRNAFGRVATTDVPLSRPKAAEKPVQLQLGAR
jgi:NADH-quinone oxidoreductase subunit L